MIGSVTGAVAPLYAVFPVPMSLDEFVFSAWSISHCHMRPADNGRAGWNGVLFDVNLNGSRSPRSIAAASPSCRSTRIGLRSALSLLRDGCGVCLRLLPSERCILQGGNVWPESERGPCRKQQSCMRCCSACEYRLQRVNSTCSALLHPRGSSRPFASLQRSAPTISLRT